MSRSPAVFIFRAASPCGDIYHQYALLEYKIHLYDAASRRGCARRMADDGVGWFRLGFPSLDFPPKPKRRVKLAVDVLINLCSPLVSSHHHYHHHHLSSFLSFSKNRNMLGGSSIKIFSGAHTPSTSLAQPPKYSQRVSLLCRH